MKAEPDKVIYHAALHDDVWYRALLERDKGFEGIFWAGIKTTGIFCRPDCPARKPKRENVIFFTSIRQALEQGFRPCRKCRPLLRYGDTPVWIRDILAEIEDDAGDRFRDTDLRARGVDPVRLRRWFKKYHGMTFQVYLRTRRINAAYREIKSGGKVTMPAMDAGYGSLSGFHAAFRKQTGFSPSASRKHTLVTVRQLLSPLGPMLAGCTDEGICFLDFQDDVQSYGEREISNNGVFGEGTLFGTHPLLNSLARQLDEYFNGQRRRFELPLHIIGTDFQERAWRALLEIPYAETRSYQAQAEMIGNRRAVRAVAGANAANRIAIIIPCHRVIGKDGNLAGYGAGVWRKQFLLAHEKAVLSRETDNT